MEINITLDDARAQGAIERLIKAGEDMTPLMRDIGNEVLKSTRDRFVSQEDPDGIPWEALSPRTVARKRKFKDKILTESGELSLGLTFRAGRSEVEIGSPSVYANTHQYGAIAGEFGFAGSVPLPFGDIPARPFLGVSDDDRLSIQTIVTDYLAERWA